MIARAYRTAAGAGLAAIVLGLPLAALLVPSRFGPVWAAAMWAAGILASFVGWGGWLVRRLMPASMRGEVDIGLRAAWGLCLSVAVGGVACCLGIAYRAVLLAWLFAGIALAARQLFERARRLPAERRPWRELLARWDVPVVAGLLVLVAVAFAGAATRDIPNPNDDWLAYLPFAHELLQTGTFIQPFSLRRMAAYGGQSLMQAMTLIGSDDAQVHLFDQGICRVVLMALVLGFSRESRGGARVVVVMLALVVLMLPEVRVNSTSEASGALGFVAIFRSMVFVDRHAMRGWRAALLLALPLAAVCTLRQNYQVGAAIMWAALMLRAGEAGWPERRRQTLQVAALTALCLLPWAALAFRSNGSFLFPLFHGNYDPDYAGLTPDSSWTARLKLLLTVGLAGEPVKLLPLLLLVAPAAAHNCNRRALLGLWLGTIVGVVSLCFSLPEAELLSVQRYAFATLTAFLIGTGLAASDGGRGLDRAVTVAVVVVLALQIHDTHRALEKNFVRAIDRLGSRDRLPPPLAVERPNLQRLQAAVPARDPLLVMIERPYLLDFARNRILLLDQPGAVSPPPHIRPLDGGGAMADNLRAQGIRYFAFVYPDKAQRLYSRTTWKRHLENRTRLWRLAAPVYLATFDAVDGIAATHAKLYDDGQMAVVDLARREGIPP